MSSKTQIIPLVTSCMPQDKIDSCLDCGCGFGKWAGLLRTHLPNVANAYMVGIGIFLGNLKFCKKYGVYDDLVLADISRLPFRTDCFDVVIACEVIEHLEKRDGIEFLANLEKLGKRRL